jgi:hypothetical protein
LSTDSRAEFDPGWGTGADRHAADRPQNAGAVFDRYNIVNEQELLTAGARLAAYVAKSGS